MDTMLSTVTKGSKEWLSCVDGLIRRSVMMATTALAALADLRTAHQGKIAIQRKKQLHHMVYYSQTHQLSLS